MLGRHLLLIPDSGDELLRLGRTAALFGEKIYFFSLPELFPPALIYALSKNATDRDREVISRAVAFTEYHAKIKPDLDLMKSEGILVSLSDALVASKELTPLLLQRAQVFVARLKHEMDSMKGGDRDAFRKKIIDAVRMHPASFSDVMQMTLTAILAANGGARIPFVSGNDGTKIDPEASTFLRNTDPILISVGFYVFYLLTVLVMAESHGAGILSWSGSTRDAVWSLHKGAFSDSVNEESFWTNSNAGGLGHQVLSTNLPSVADLPTETVLNTRTRLRSEVEGFARAISQIGHEIDPASTPQEADRVIERLVNTEINPAIDELRRSIRSNVYGTVGQAGSLAIASLTLAFLPGQALDLASLAGALGTTFKGIVKDRELKGSQWALIVRA